MDASRKLAHAQKRLRELDRRVRAFAVTDPYAVASDVNLTTGEGRFWIAILNEPPTLVSLLIGDFLYALRSSLDQLAWEIADRHAPPAPDNTEFPIFKDCAKYCSTRPGGGAFKVRGLPASAQAAIERLQPYHAGQSATSEPLWVLHNLSNIDKHRFLHVAQGCLVALTRKARSSEGKISFTYERPAGPIEQDADLVRFTVTPPDATMNVEVVPTFGITFDERAPIPGQLVLPALGDLLGYVRNKVFRDPALMP